MADLVVLDGRAANGNTGKVDEPRSTIIRFNRLRREQQIEHSFAVCCKHNNLYPKRSETAICISSAQVLLLEREVAV